MACIVQPKSQPKHRWIQFTDQDKKRQTIRLGICTKEIASEHKTLVEDLLSAKLSGFSMAPRVAEKVANLEPVYRAKYIKVGLLPSDGYVVRTKKELKLGKFLENYFKARSSDLKKSSQVAMGHTKNRLIEFFGENRAVNSITANDAREFRVWLASANKRDKDDDGKAKPLSANTIRRRTGFCKQIFSQAVTDGIIQRNPFAGMAASVRSNKERTHYVPLPTINRVLKFAPNAKWKAMIVLARVAALRVPSELAGLKWEHIRFEEKRILIVDSSKNQRHANRQLRKIPMMPILEEHLAAWRNECEPGDEVFPGLSGETNLRTTLQKILVKAGVSQWPKLWQNLRASGCTDFARTLQPHVAAAICGHTVQIAQEHYWQVADTDLDSVITQAITMQPERLEPVESAPEAKSEAQPSDIEVNSVSTEIDGHEKTLENVDFPGFSDSQGGRYWTRTNDPHDVKLP